MTDSLNHEDAMPAKATEASELELLRVRVATLAAACAEGEQACRAAQHSLSTFITYFLTAIIILDIETGQFLEANPSAEQLFRFPHTALLEMGRFELSPPYRPDGSSSTRAKEMVGRAVSGGDPVNVSAMLCGKPFAQQDTGKEKSGTGTKMVMSIYSV